jgi:hypothetical protein
MATMATMATKPADRFRAAVFVALVLATLVLVGIGAAKWWPHASPEYYSVIAQIIVTLFLAVAIEFFTGSRDRADLLDRVLVFPMIAIAWLGLFACLRAIARGGSAFTAGVAAAGVSAAADLIAILLYERLKKDEPALAGPIVVALIAAPILILVLI